MLEIKRTVVGIYRTNCYALLQNNTSVIIDPGFNMEKIEAMIEGTKVLGILLTHGHLDHISAIKDLVKKYKIPIYMSKKEDALLHLEKEVPQGYYRNFEGEYFDLKEGEFDLGDFHFEIIETPGHSAGSVLIRCGKHLFTGDTLFKGTIGRTDVFSSDTDAMRRSIEKIKTLNPEYIIYPGHSATSTLEHEFQTNPFYLEDLL